MAHDDNNAHDYCAEASFYDTMLTTPTNTEHNAWDGSVAAQSSSTSFSPNDGAGGGDAFFSSTPTTSCEFAHPNNETSVEETMASASFELDRPPSYTLAAAYYHTHPYYTHCYGGHEYPPASPFFNQQVLPHTAMLPTYPDFCAGFHSAAAAAAAAAEYCCPLPTSTLFDAVGTDNDLFPVTPADEANIQPATAAHLPSSSHDSSATWCCPVTTAAAINFEPACASVNNDYEPSIIAHSHHRHHEKRPKRSNRPGHHKTKDKKKCANCGATKTPSWRRGPITKRLLCNACGLYEKVNQRRRTVLVQADGSTRVSRGNIRAEQDLICGGCRTNEAKRWHVRKHEMFCERCARDHDYSIQTQQP